MDDATVLLDRLHATERELAARDAVIADHVATITERDAALAERDAAIARLHAQLAALHRLLKAGSERRVPEIDAADQTVLLFAEIQAAADRVAAEKGVEARVQVPPRERKAPRRRDAFPAHVPRLETSFVLPEAQRTCPCGGDLVAMGEVRTQELERLETTWVHEIVRAKYCCRTCREHVETAPGPDRVFDKTLLGTSFVAHVANERFAHHMPYHRQEKKYASEGLPLSRTVLCDGVRRAADLLEPIGEALRQDILEGPVMHLDDTSVKLRSGRAAGASASRLWILSSPDGRTSFEWSPDRSSQTPCRLLAGWSGKLVADDYKGHEVLYKDGSIVWCGCWAHARRYFVEAEASEPEFSKEAVDRIRELYAVEQHATELQLDAEGRRTLRQECTAPRLDAFLDWMTATRTQVLDKGPLAKAIDYATSNWQALRRFLEDGRVPIDNNTAERGIRGVAVGRKNWLFFGNEEGGRRAALFFGLVETCRAAGISFRDWLRDVLVRISSETDVRRLLPHAWKEHFLPEVLARRDALLSRLGLT